VELGTHRTASGVDFYTISPKGNVPTIVLADGTVLDENAATLQYIVDNSPLHNVGPAPATHERYRLQALLSFISSEIHSRVGPLFNPATSEEVKTFLKGIVNRKLQYLQDNLLAGGKRFLLGDGFTVADAYLYIVLSWAPHLGLDLSPFPGVKAYWDGIAALDGVKAAHARIAEKPAHV